MRVFAWEQHVYDVLQGTPPWARVLLRVVNLAAWTPLAVLGALVLAPEPLARVVLLALPLELALKWAFERQRPTEPGLGFPSGDAMLAAALYGGLVGWWATPLVILVMLARVVKGAHWPLDVIVGAVLGAALLRLA